MRWFLLVGLFLMKKDSAVAEPFGEWWMFLLLACAATVGAFFVRSEEMTNHACANTFAASRSGTEVGTKDTTTVGCSDMTCTIVAEPVVQVCQTATVIATVENVACHS
jgi:hypothetical protein